MNMTVCKNLWLFLILLLLLPLLLNSQASTSNWPMFQYNAQHTGYNDQDSISVPLELLWSKKITPVSTVLEPATIVGDTMILANEYSDPFTNPILYSTIHVLDINTGEYIWKKEFQPIYIHFFDQPCYYRGKFYIREHTHSVWDTMRVVEYDLETGTPLIWYTYTAQNDDQLGSIVYKDKLLFPAGMYNGVYCADVVLDEYIWGADLPQIGYWSPAAYDTVVYSWCKTLLTATNINTGQRLWYIAPDYYDTARHASSYIINDDLELVLQGYKSNYTFADYPFNWAGMNTATVVDTLTNMVYCYYIKGFH